MPSASPGSRNSRRPSDPVPRILLVLSPAYFSTETAAFVDLLAQTYGLETSTWPVIPLRLARVDLPTRLAMLTALDATDPDERELSARADSAICSSVRFLGPARPLSLPRHVPVLLDDEFPFLVGIASAKSFFSICARAGSLP